MVKFIPAIALLSVLFAVGLYWVVFSRHFLAWTTIHDRKVHQLIDRRMPHPVFIPRARANYARLQANGGIRFLTLAVRVLGSGLALTSVFILIVVIRIAAKQ